MLRELQTNQPLEREVYKQRLEEAQTQLARLGWEVYSRKRPVVIVFEGPDAAGKGGAIRRMTEALDPRGFHVHPIAAPSSEALAHHYLWRFWKRLPPLGEIAIFDRSWYGRVLVERVEGFAKDVEWQRAYDEIRTFERQLYKSGTIVIKFWVHISKEEQLIRFNARAETDYKSWKLTDEDWRNRDKWDLYVDAAEEMIQKTHRKKAPWVVVEGDHKWYARVKVLESLVRELNRVFL